MEDSKLIGWLTQESKKCLRGSIKQPQSTIRERIDSDKEAIAYLVLDEAEILLKTIQGHDKVCDPPPPIDGSEGMKSTPKYVIPML